MSRRLGESIVSKYLLISVTLVLIALTGQNQSAVGVRFDSAECRSLDGYMADLHALAVEIAGPDWTFHATPVASPAPDTNPSSMSPADLITASDRFHIYAQGLKTITPPPIAEAWQASRVELMETFASYYRAIAQRGAYAAALWTSTLEQDLQRATTDTFDLMATCRSFLTDLDANDLFGTFVTGADLATPAGAYP
jgi:hypothetical protein